MSEMNGDGDSAASSSTVDNARNEVLADLWAKTPFSREALSRARLQGDRKAPSSFKVAEMAQATIAASALAASEFWSLRGGHPQTIGVEREHAAVEFHSEIYLRVDGAPAGEIRDPL